MLVAIIILLFGMTVSSYMLNLMMYRTNRELHDELLKLQEPIAAWDGEIGEWT